jgi:DNA-binding transcriptional LysR family regulator
MGSMDWDNVRVFLAVARAGQFVAAARRLRLDHATVSRRVAALEAALGARLFERLTTGARLTCAGERFLAAAEEMESAFLQAQAEVSGVDVELSGDVRIGAPDGFATYYLAEALRDFVARNPGLRLQPAPAPQLTPLARREVDVVVGLDKPEEGRFVVRKLTDYSLGVYASAAYLAERGAPRADSASAWFTITSPAASPISRTCRRSAARCALTGSSPKRTRADSAASAPSANT